MQMPRKDLLTEKAYASSRLFIASDLSLGRYIEAQKPTCNDLPHCGQWHSKPPQELVHEPASPLGGVGVSRTEMRYSAGAIKNLRGLVEGSRSAAT